MVAVLLIDDEQMILMMLKMGLETYGYQVEIAASGEEGTDKFNNNHFDIAITDMEGPVWTAGTWYAISENRSGTVSCRSIDW